MTKNEITINKRTCFLYQDAAATHLLIQPIDEHDMEVLDQEVDAIKELSDKPFSLVAFMINDWNQELTPLGCTACVWQESLWRWSRKDAGVHYRSTIADGSRRHSSPHTWWLFPCRPICLMDWISDRQV